MLNLYRISQKNQPQNNNIMKIKHLFAGMLAMAATVACQPEKPVEEAKLEVSKATVELAATAAQSSFDVTSNKDWTATADADWVTLDPASGAASDQAVTVKVTAADNAETTARTATVTVTTGELTKTVSVTQAAAEPEPEPEPEPVKSDWAVVGSFTGEGWGWDPGAGIPLYVLDDEYFVVYGLELPAAAEFKFLQGGAWGGAEVGASMSVVEPNTIQVKGGSNIKVMEAGKYDLYLAADASKFYVMSEGKTPAEATEPAPVAVTYTVAGTIADQNWNNANPAALMVEEGAYLVAKNIPFVWASTLYGGAEQIEFKIFETGSWNGYGEANGASYTANAEVPVAAGAQGNIIVVAPEGTYDVYLDLENSKVWLMEAGLKPGEGGSAEPETKSIIDDKQWEFTWKLMGDVPSVLDFGVTVPGYWILAFDGGAFDESLAGVMMPYMAAEYKITETDATSGVITLTADGQSIEIPYSDATETGVTISAESLLGEVINCTVAASKIEITF